MEERNGETGQIGVICGCDVSDTTILQIVNKAVECIPPITVRVYIENTATLPILRIQIPSSETKPHCTPKGVYCVRDGTRNRALHPSELLRVFLESEANAFATRFEAAAETITTELSNLEHSLDTSIQNMAIQLSWADDQLDNTENTLNAIKGIAGATYKQADDLTLRLRALFRQDKREDPVRQRVQSEIFAKFVEDIEENPELRKRVLVGEKLTLVSKKSPSPDLTKDEATELLGKAMAVVRDKEDLKRYSVHVAAPSKFEDVDLEAAAALAADQAGSFEAAQSTISSALQLGIIKYENDVVGSAAIMEPSADIKARVFNEARSVRKPADFPFELGIINLLPHHRKKAQMAKLMKQLLPAANKSQLFAISTEGDEFVHQVLAETGFSAEECKPESAGTTDQTIRLHFKSSDSKKPVSG